MDPVVRFAARNLASLLLIGASAFALQSAGGYHLLKKIPFPAAEGGGEYFDYITFDPSSRRIYLARGTEIEVLDADRGTVAGVITGFKRDHGIALIPDLGRGFITDGAAALAVIFDLKTLKIIGQVKVDPDADSVLYDPASKHVFVFSGEANSATVIDPAKETVIARLPLGGAPEQAVADGKGMIYNNLQDKNEVIAFDSRTLQIKARWPVAPGGRPVSIAMDRQHGRLFIGGRDPQSLVVLNADNGKIVAGPFPIGARVDTSVYDPETGLVASSTGDGAISIFHEDSPDKLSVVETIKTEFGAKTMAIDPRTHNLYVDTSDFETPAATGGKQPQPKAIPGTFRLLIYGR